MKITFNPEAKTSFNHNHRIETASIFTEVVAIVPDKSNRFGDFPIAKTVVTLRIYGKGSTYYACLWVSNDKFQTQGSAKVSGSGYNKSKEAVKQAILNAGYSIEDVVGEVHIQQAVLQLAITVFPDTDKILIHEAHA